MRAIVRRRLIARFVPILFVLLAAPLAAAAAQPFDAEPVRFPAVTLADPGGRVLLYFELKNTGSSAWAPGQVALSNIKNPLGGPAQVSVNRNVLPNETVYWDFEAVAPTMPGITESTWQLISASQRIGPVMTCYVIVVPTEARALRGKIQALIDQFNAQNGTQVKQLIRQITELIAKESGGALRQMLHSRCSLIPGLLAALGIVVALRRRSPLP